MCTQVIKYVSACWYFRWKKTKKNNHDWRKKYWIVRNKLPGACNFSKKGGVYSRWILSKKSVWFFDVKYYFTMKTALVLHFIWIFGRKICVFRWIKVKTYKCFMWWKSCRGFIRRRVFIMNNTVPKFGVKM